MVQTRHLKRRGTVAVLVALVVTALFGYVAISTDGGVLLAQHQRTQSAADAAAMAAASVLYQHYPDNNGTDPNGLAAQTALDEAANYGLNNDGVSSVVTVNIPPASGPYQGLAGYVEVIIHYNQARFFSNVLGTGTLPVSARAVARGAWTVPNDGVIVLNYSGKGTLSDQGNGAFTEIGAPVIVNSNNASAAMDTGNGILKAPEFDITGGYSISGSGQMLTSPVANNILTGIHPTPDPLAYLPAPAQPSPGTTSKISLGGGHNQYTLSPGSFTNLPNFSAGDVVIFQQASAGNGGIFYLTAGGLNSQGATLKMDPNTSGGIMIYNAGTGTNDKINITGNSAGTVSLSPLTDGPYTGLAFFQARNASQDVQIAGNGNFTIYGTFYASDALLKVTGNGAVSNIGSQYISLDLALSGNGNIAITYDPKLLARTRIITLVE
jgi:hypothetical protein